MISRERCDRTISRNPARLVLSRIYRMRHELDLRHKKLFMDIRGRAAFLRSLFPTQHFVIFKWRQEEKDGENREILSRKLLMKTSKWKNYEEVTSLLIGLRNYYVLAQISQTRSNSPYRTLESHRESTILTGWGLNVGVENGYDKVNIQTSAKTSVNVIPRQLCLVKRMSR